MQHGREGGRRRGRRRQAHLMSEINVTPFVDVMLVFVDHFHGGRAASDRRRAHRFA